MSPYIVVPDASVILKWVLPSGDEPDLGLALELRDAIAGGRVRAVVPHLWIYEVGNTLARRQPARADHALEVLLRFDLESAPATPTWLGLVLDLTRRFAVTFHDAAYHAHAIEMRGTFVTADERYVSRTREAGFVVRLSEWGAAGPG